MTKLRCCFCQQELEIGGVDGILRGCPKCRNLGTEMLWQELTKTKRALDVAVNALNLYSTSSLSAMAKEVLRIIKQITENEGSDNE